jgi:hypothetical protein
MNSPILLFRKVLLFTLSVSLPAGCGSPSYYEPNLLRAGKARFEIFGMLSEYMGRDLCPPHIESFYPSERKQVLRFEQVLNEFAVEEGVPARWKRTRLFSGHYDFANQAISKAINQYYTAQDHPYAIGAKIGYLTPPHTFKNATKPDLLRFVAGVYTRQGDRDSARRAMFDSANDPEKMLILASVLQKLGCTDVMLFRSKNEVPTSFCLFFNPSPDVAKWVGIKRSITKEEFEEYKQGDRLMRMPIKSLQL